jgi:hypothetical protein
VDKPEALTFFGEPFVDDSGPAIAAMDPRGNLYATIWDPYGPGSPWICRVYWMGNGIVWEDDPRPGPHLIRKAEAAYIKHVRDLAAVAGLDVDE